MKKKVIFFINNDEIFTFPIVVKLIERLNKNYNIFLKLGETSLKKKIKILLILFFDGSIVYLLNYYKNKIKLETILSNKNVKLIKGDINEKNFDFGVSINFPKKIFFHKLNIYNFHFGNFSQQRGTFIFFYKYVFNWKKINLTFHRIDSNYDAGQVLNTKSLGIKNMKAIDLIALPLKHINFYENSIKMLKRKPHVIKTKIGKICREPSFLKIFLTFLK